MATIGGIMVYLTVNSIGLHNGLAQASAELKAFQAEAAGTSLAPGGADPYKNIRKGAAVASLAILGIGAASVHVATQFEYQMKLIETQIGAGMGEVVRMKEAILGMAAAVGQTPEDLSKGLFHIEAVGKRGAEALEILDAAAKGAAISNASLETTANALVAVLATGIGGIKDVSEAMAIMNGIAGTGNIRLEQLGKSFSTGLLSTAKNFGMTLKDVGAALAVLSDQGVPVQEGATRLRVTIALLAAPTRQATQELARIGLTQRALADELRSDRGLYGAVSMLQKKMNEVGLDAVEQAQLMKNAFGGARSAQGLLGLAGNMDLWLEKIANIEQKSLSFEDDFKKASETAQFHFKQLSASLDVVAIHIGNALLPMVKSFIDVLVAVTSHAEALTIVFFALAGAMIAFAVRAVAGVVSGLAGVAKQFIVNALAQTSFGRSILNTIAPLELQSLMLRKQEAAQAKATMAQEEATARQANAIRMRMKQESDAALLSKELSAQVTAAYEAQAAAVIGATTAATQAIVQGEERQVVAIRMSQGIRSEWARMFETEMTLAAAVAERAAAQIALAQARIDLAAAQPRRNSIGQPINDRGRIISAQAVAEATAAQAAAVVAAEERMAAAQTAATVAMVRNNQSLQISYVERAQAIVQSNAAIGIGVSGMGGVMVIAEGAVSNLSVAEDHAAARARLLAQAQTQVAAATAATVAPTIDATAATWNMVGAFQAAQRQSAATAATVTVATDTAVSRMLATMKMWASRITGLALGVVTALMIVPLAMEMLAGPDWIDKFDRGLTVIKIALLSFLREVLNVMKQIPFVGDAVTGVFNDVAAEVELNMQRLAEQNAALAAKEEERNAINSLHDFKNMTEAPEGVGTIFGPTMEDARMWRLAGAENAKEYADGVKSQRNAILDTWGELMELMKTPMTEAQETARIMGMLQSKELADGLASGDVAVLTKAEQLKQELEARLGTLNPGFAAKQGDMYKRLMAEALEPTQFDAAATTAAYHIAEQLRATGKIVGSGDILADFKNRMIQDGVDLAQAIATVQAEVGTGKWAGPEVQAALDSLRSLVQGFEATAPSASRATAALDEYKRSLIEVSELSIEDQAAELITRFGQSAQMIHDLAGSAGADVMAAFADGLISGWSSVDSALEQLWTMTQGQWSTQRRVAYLMAQLQSAEFAQGLASSDPLIAAQYEKTKDVIIAQLVNLTGGVAQIGFESGKIYSEAFSEAMKNWDPANPDSALDYADSVARAKVAQMQAEWQGILGGLNMDQANKDVNAFYQNLIDKSTSATSGVKNLAGEVNSNLTTAFNNIQAAANRYFEDLHNKNLQAIRDAHDHKQALLDAKMAREERPITRLEKALAWRQAEQQEARLREAVAKATDPRARQEAQWNLQNFLDQRHINEMRDELDQNKELINAQKKRNDDKYNAQVEAENKRYQRQKQDFQRELDNLERFLKKHPEMWDKTQSKIIALLRDYGVDYKDVGKLMGRNFATSINKEIDTVVTNLKKLWDATHPNSKGTGGTGANTFGAVGGKKGTGGAPGVQDTVSGAAARIGTGNGTLIVKIGDKTFAEITDESLYVQGTIYSQTGNQSLTGTGKSSR